MTPAREPLLSLAVEVTRGRTASQTAIADSSDSERRVSARLELVGASAAERRNTQRRLCTRRRRFVMPGRCLDIAAVGVLIDSVMSGQPPNV